MLEFTLAFMSFLVIMMGIIEFSRVLNVLVTLNSVAATAAMVGAREDPMGQIRNADVVQAAQNAFGVYNYLDPARLTVTANVNHTSPSGTFHTKVTLVYQMPPLMIPGEVFAAGEANGGIPIRVAVARANEIQMFRP